MNKGRNATPDRGTLTNKSFLVLFFKKELLAFLCLCVTGCATTLPPGLPLAASAYTDLPGYAADDLSALGPMLALQCRRLSLLPADAPLGGAGLAQTYGGHAGNWAEACAAWRRLPPHADLHAFFADWFQPYRLGEAALVTGYFEPVLHASLHRGGIYQTPALARPADLVQGGPPDALGRPGLGRVEDGRIVPYASRAEIEAGALGQAAKPVAWLASPADLFFAQIQGSARLALAEGGTLRLAFDGRNGRPYTPIGRILAEQGAIPPGQISMQSIRAWLDAHPADAQAMMDRNESYVFFRALPETDRAMGPIGAMGIALTAGRSAAVDRAFVPLGSPVFVDSTVPDGRVWRHLVLAQDLGAAITGQARLDVFLGSGALAGEWAGRMQQAGRLWLLLPRPAAPGTPSRPAPAA